VVVHITAQKSIFTHIYTSLQPRQVTAQNEEP